MPLKRFKTDLPQPLRSSVLVDSHGFPRYWACVWSTLFAQHLAPSSRSKKLRHIEALYAFADASMGSGHLDRILSECDLERIAPVLEGYFVSIHNRATNSGASQAQWLAAQSFVDNVIMGISKNHNHFQSSKSLKLKLHHLGNLYRQLKPHSSRSPEHLRSLPAEVVAHLYECMDPEFSDHPFSRLRVRWNVYLAFIIMLHQGLRRGELLLLPVDAVKSGFDNRRQMKRYWINIESAHEAVDPRHNKPSIKNPNSVRQLPVSETTARIIQVYVENFRGRANHPFLLNSQWNTPVSHETITAYFRKISQCLPSDVRRTLTDRTGKTSVEAHDLRHTCAVVRLSQLLEHGDSMDEALQKLRNFFGWSRDSDMPKKYARAVFEDRFADVWSNILDDRVNVLRAIPRGFA